MSTKPHQDPAAELAAALKKVDELTAERDAVREDLKAAAAVRDRHLAARDKAAKLVRLKDEDLASVGVTDPLVLHWVKVERAEREALGAPTASPPQTATPEPVKAAPKVHK